MYLSLYITTVHNIIQFTSRKLRVAPYYTHAYTHDIINANSTNIYLKSKLDARKMASSDHVLFLRKERYVTTKTKFNRGRWTRVLYNSEKELVVHECVRFLPFFLFVGIN